VLYNIQLNFQSSRGSLLPHEACQESEKRFTDGNSDTLSKMKSEKRNGSEKNALNLMDINGMK